MVLSVRLHSHYYTFFCKSQYRGQLDKDKLSHLNVFSSAPDSCTPASTSTDDPDDLDDIDIFLEVDEDEDEEFDYVDPEDNPVSEVISGVKDWWDTFSLFSSKTTTDATITSQPDDDDHEEEDDKDEDVEDSTTMAPKRPTTTTTSTTTTTTTPLPYTLPPARESVIMLYYTSTKYG